MLNLKQHLIAFLLIGGLVITLSFPGTSGDFWFDDKSNIVSNPTLKITELSLNNLWKAAWSSPSTQLGRPLSMLSFAFNSYFSQLEPFYYKLTNIVLHAINAILLFYLSCSLLNLSIFKEKLKLSQRKIFYLAISISLLWAITPINVANILYIVQRMNELAALFVIIGVLLYIHVRTSKNLSVLKQVLYFALFTLILLLAILSKENGALLPALTLAIEIILRQCQAKTAKNNVLEIDELKKYTPEKTVLSNHIFARLILIFLVFIPGLLALYWLGGHLGKIMDSYQLRSFTLMERLLTEPRVLFFYIQQTLFPEIYQLSFYHDDYIKSSNIYTPYTTIIAILSLLAVLILAFVKRKPYPFFFLGIFWFVIAHSLESSILPLELVFEHRNYLPSYGIVFLSIIGLFLVSQKYNKEPIFYAFVGIYIFTLSINSFIVSSIRGNTTLMLKTFVEEHPKSARSQYSWSQMNEELYYLNTSEFGYYKSAIKHAGIATELDPNLINGLIYSYLLKRVHDIPANDNMDELLKRLATALPHPSNNRVLRKLFKLGVKRPELFSQSLIEKVANTYLTNPRLKGSSKANFYNEYAHYLIQANGMNLKAFELISKAVNEDPKSFRLKLSLVNGLVNLHQYQAANKLIPVLRAVDKLNRYKKEIDNVKNIIYERIQQQKN